MSRYLKVQGFTIKIVSDKPIITMITFWTVKMTNTSLRTVYIRNTFRTKHSASIHSLDSVVSLGVKTFEENCRCWCLNFVPEVLLSMVHDYLYMWIQDCIPRHTTKMMQKSCRADFWPMDFWPSNWDMNLYEGRILEYMTNKTTHSITYSLKWEWAIISKDLLWLFRL